MFIFVELFRVVGEQIGFEVLVFGPASPDMVNVLFSVFWFSEFSFSSWIYWLQNLEIFPPFLRNSCDEIIWWFWVIIVTVIFTCRYFKLSWNTSALSQSNGRNFSGSSIIDFSWRLASDLAGRIALQFYQRFLVLQLGSLIFLSM